MNSFNESTLRTIGTLRANKLAIAASVASQLPGRDFGPADAFRHVILAAELYRRFPDWYAKKILDDHEGLKASSITFNQDTYMNEVGRLIGQHVQKKGGGFKQIRKIAEAYMQANLAHIKIEDVNKWIMGGGSLKDKTEFLINPNLRSVTIDGLKLPGIALKHPKHWDRNPARDNRRPEESARISDKEANWPDAKGNWKNRFNYKGAEKYRDYDPEIVKQKELPNTDSNPGNSFRQNPAQSEQSLHEIKPQLKHSFDKSENLRDEEQKTLNEDLKRITLLKDNSSALSQPSPSESSPLNQKAQTLSQLTPELIADNPFTPDENGKTNLTKEAQILKKNKKLGLKLIQLAGRGTEFAPFFQGEDLG